MSNLYNIPKYKHMIISLLLKNDFLVKLINPQPSDSDDLDIIDVLLGGTWIINGKKYSEQGHVFDYDFVDDTITEAKTFIFVETDIDTVSHNMFADFNLYICVFTDKTLVKLNRDTRPSVKEVKDNGYFAGAYGNRVDIMCDVIDRMLNGNKKFPAIGEVRPANRGYITRYHPNKKYYGKCLSYTVRNYSGGDICDDN